MPSSANVFLAPCDFGDFEETVGSTVDLSERDDAPEALASEGTVRLWAVPEGDQNQSNFEKMAAGDLLLFYDGDTFVGTGRVGTTLEDDTGWAGETFWDDEGLTQLYTVEAFTPVEVSRAAVNRIFEYSDSWSPGGLMRVADGRVNNDPAAIKLAVEQY